MSITNNLLSIRQNIPHEVKLVAVTKTKPNEMVMEAYNCGLRVFGENRVPEMVQKHHDLPKDIKWHMIGHLQSKKVKLIAPFVSMIHSVDSMKLLSVIDAQAKRHVRRIDVLLQFRIAEEETKFGLTLETAQDLLNDPALHDMNNVRFCGVMGMATNTSDSGQVLEEFKRLKEIHSFLKAGPFNENPDFKEISMGMSGDHQLAIKAGSTMVRVGSTIFGAR